ncbi:hypothetical protein FE257_007351 [Aspergillus nanangensis]|uniref:N-acetyltransferase domain-containing protein n=1 Tax=Aspergillus nanangensis TaxID=2582783 RepID=A0AAD4CMU8_ASPNN|nr:hypothetical protein FE257_007351 [Aspergillus nanangensis]
MSLPPKDGHFDPFAILTPRLILIPTPVAINVNSYRALYASLHADVHFCSMAFGDHFPARNWDDAQTRTVIQTRDIDRSWNRHHVGDFAVGLRGPAHSDDTTTTGSILTDDAFTRFAGDNLEQIQWVGYAGVRDATTTSLPAADAADADAVGLPPWQEMVELRYGISSQFWGGGIAKEAAEAVMGWAVDARGVRRFIAETERGNSRSGRLLQKMGFGLSGTDYWKEPSEVEWELVVQ